jgi:hypothetical protein
MYKKCFLHIGMEKTGTTSIQKFWIKNRQALKRRGYFYSRVMGRDNHVNLIVYAREDNTSDNQRKRALARAGLNLNDFRKKLEAEFRDEASCESGRNLVLSNEHLQSRLTTISEKVRLKNLILKVCGNIDVYLYVRRQDLVATSVFGTRLLSGGLTTLGEIFPKIVEGEELPYFYNYKRIYDEYVDVFGVDNVHVRFFEKDRLVEHDVRIDFLDWIGITERSEFRFGPRENESISVAAQFFMSRMNVHNPAFYGKAPNPLRGEVDKRASRLCGGRGRRPARDEAIAFYKHFHKDNSDLFKSAGIDGNFAEDFSTFPETAEQEIRIGDVADVGVQLFKDLVMDLNKCRIELFELRAAEKKRNGKTKEATTLIRQAIALGADENFINRTS